MRARSLPSPQRGGCNPSLSSTRRGTHHAGSQKTGIGAPYLLCIDRTQEFPPRLASIRAARHLVADVLSSSGYEGDVDTVLLLVSELCTNAVRHAATEFEVHIEADRHEVTVTVVDHDPAHQPQLRNPGPQATSGRGLFIVQRLSKSWGCETRRQEKLVWFCCT